MKDNCVEIGVRVSVPEKCKGGRKKTDSSDYDLKIKTYFCVFSLVITFYVLMHAKNKVRSAKARETNHVQWLNVGVGARATESAKKMMATTRTT